MSIRKQPQAAAARLERRYSYLVGRQPFLQRVFKSLFYYYSKAVFTFYTPLAVYGRENIPDCSFIFCSNHNSHMDVAVLSAAARRSFNHFGMLAARDYWFDSSLKRRLINSVMNLIPVDRQFDKADKLSIQNTLRLCRSFMHYRNRCLIFFPEGTRGRPGRILPFKKGAASFALSLGVPIVPAVIHGSHVAWPRRRVFMKPGPISVHILKPIVPESFARKNETGEEQTGAAADRMTRALQDAITRKAGEIYG